MQIEDDEKDTSYLAGSWFCVAGETQLKRLMLSLNPEGRRESKLLISLANNTNCLYMFLKILTQRYITHVFPCQRFHKK